MATVRPAYAGALRLGLVYSALYAANGIASPYMPLWFRAVGLSGEQIGLLLAMPMLARIVAGPALGLYKRCLASPYMSTVHSHYRNSKFKQLPHSSFFQGDR